MRGEGRGEADLPVRVVISTMDGIPKSGVVGFSHPRHMECVAFRGSKVHETAARARSEWENIRGLIICIDVQRLWRCQDIRGLTPISLG